MPAGSAEPWLRTQLQPRSIRRPFRHETQNMPLCWPRPSRASCRPPSQLRPAPVAVARTPPPETPGRFRRAVSLLLVQGVPAAGGVMSGRDSRPPDAPAAGNALLDAGVRRAVWVRCSADVQFVRVVLGDLHVRCHIGHAGRLERGEELLGSPPVHMALDCHTVTTWSPFSSVPAARASRPPMSWGGLCLAASARWSVRAEEKICRPWRRPASLAVPPGAATLRSTPGRAPARRLLSRPARGSSGS